MPQLSQASQIYASQFFWLAIVFALIYFGIGKAMVPRIERTVDDRAARIAGDLSAAEGARRAADDADARYAAGLDAARSEAARAVAEAQAQGAARSEARLKASDAETDARVDAALARLDEARAGALREIEATTTDAAEAIVAKLSGVRVDRAAVERQVRAELVNG